MYQELIGELLYLANRTRPDISFVMSYLSQFNHNPEKRHYNLAKRVLRYLMGSKDKKLLYENEFGILNASSDASWGNAENGKSFSGGVVLLDSQAAIQWIKGTRSSNKSRHMNLRFHFIKDLIEDTENRDYTGMWVRLGSTDLMAGKVMFLRSNQGDRLDGNESVADSFRSDLVGFKSWSATILGAFILLRLPEKPSTAEKLTCYPSFVNLKEGRSDGRPPAPEIQFKFLHLPCLQENRDYTGMWVRLGSLWPARPVRCVPLTATHKRLRLTWSREHALWTPQQWSCVTFSDESKFSLQSDSRGTLIWRALGTRYHQENTIERHRYGGVGWRVWGGIILETRTDLHVQSVTMTGHIYRNVILEQHERLFWGAMGAEFLFMDDNARAHRANIVEECLQSDDITRMDCPAAYSPDLNPI
ncbi:transposable element Tcb1 transposase [Trichonephila clavipes]|nr:transposable element Tcb1 transposase [Trichonephila clavipes]